MIEAAMPNLRNEYEHICDLRPDLSDNVNEANARLIASAPELLSMLERIAEKVRRANSIQHSGGTIDAEDWSELYAIQNEAFGLIAKAKGTQ